MVCILTFMSRINILLGWVEYKMFQNLQARYTVASSLIVKKIEIVWDFTLLYFFVSLI